MKDDTIPSHGFARRALIGFAGAVAVMFAIFLPTASGAEDRTPADLTELSLEELLALEVRDVRAGEPGSYALRLAEYSGDRGDVRIHGYMTTELEVPHGEEKNVSSFDLHHAVVAFRTELADRLVPEVSLEYEHAGTEFYLSFAFVDFLIRPELIARVGYFVAPIGAFNEYQYPDFLRGTAGVPVLGRDVVPGLWSEVGVQLRGLVPIGGAGNFNYALFVSNGLEQPDPTPDDQTVPEGGSLREMRRHAEEAHDSDKAVGGRLGVSLAPGVDLGLSGYTGAYTVDGERRLSIADADWAIQRSRWLVRFEAAAAVEEITGGRLTKKAGYLMASYRASRKLEPYFWVEASDLDAGPESRRTGLLGGIAYHFTPEKLRTASVRAEWRLQRDSTGDVSGVASLQTTLSF
jgi:hypothetical protein